MRKSIEQPAPAAPVNPAAGWRPWLWWSLALAWMALIFVLSAQSSFDFVSTRWQVDPVSWTAHFGEYAVLALLFWQALRQGPRLSPWAAPLAFGLAVLYAISDEWHQFYVPGRYSDGRDVLVDAAGALAALLLARKLLAYFPPRG